MGDVNNGLKKYWHERRKSEGSVMVARFLGASRHATDKKIKQKLYSRGIKMKHCLEQPFLVDYNSRDIFYYCHDPFCPMCRNKRNRTFFMESKSVVERYFDLYPNNRFLFLSLTVRNIKCNLLKETINKMSKAWRGVFSDYQKDYLFLGYMRRLEITVGKKEKLHPHLHILVSVPYYFQFNTSYCVDIDDLTEKWQDNLKTIDYVPRCNIRYLLNANKDEALRTVIGRCSYMSKDYKSLSVNGLNNDNFIDFAEDIKGVNFKTFGGDLKKIHAPLKEQYKALKLINNQKPML